SWDGTQVAKPLPVSQHVRPLQSALPAHGVAPSPPPLVAPPSPVPPVPPWPPPVAWEELVPAEAEPDGLVSPEPQPAKPLSASERTIVTRRAAISPCYHQRARLRRGRGLASPGARSGRGRPASMVDASLGEAARPAL